MHRGYVKDYRKGIEHPLFSKPLVWHFWNYCRLRANYKYNVIDFNGEPFEVERGSFIMSLKTASKDTGLTSQNIRTAIKKLVSHGMIEKSTKELTKQATLIKIVKYDIYQPLEEETNKGNDKVTTKLQQSNDKVTTTNKKEKNVKTEKKEKINKPDNVTDQTWKDVLLLRKSKKAPLTERALKGIIREAEKAGWSIEAAFEEMCLRGWTGFKADWVNKKGTNFQQNTQADIFEDLLNESNDITLSGNDYGPAE